MFNENNNGSQLLYHLKDTYYVFNHIDFNITYHSGGGEDWGIGFGDSGGRIVCQFSVLIYP